LSRISLFSSCRSESMNSPGNGGGLPAADANSETIATLLALARQRFNEGNPRVALQAVVVALRTIGGEEAVISALGRARDVYQNRSRTLEATDELTALFAQCAIATLPSSDLVAPSADMAVETSTPPPPTTTSSSQVEMDMMDQNNNNIQGLGSSILAESGREQVVWDASADGSSFLCQQCGGVVSNLRRDEHFAHWCSTPRSR